MLKYLLALTFLLWPSPAAGDGGDGGLVNLPGGGSRQVLEPVHHIVDGIGIVSTGGGYIVLGPVQGFLDAGQKLTTSWVDDAGFEHTVETEVGSPSQIDLYIRRHDKLVQAYKVLYPPRTQQDPRVGGQVLTPSELRQVSREEHNQSRNLPPLDAGGRLEGDRLVRTVEEHNAAIPR